MKDTTKFSLNKIDATCCDLSNQNARVPTHSRQLYFINSYLVRILSKDRIRNLSGLPLLKNSLFSQFHVGCRFFMSRKLVLKTEVKTK